MNYKYQDINPLYSLFKRGHLAEVIVACEQGLNIFLKNNNVFAQNIIYFCSNADNIERRIKQDSYQINDRDQQTKKYDKFALDFLNNYCKIFHDNQYFLDINENNLEKTKQYIEDLSLKEKMILFLYNKGLDPWYDKSLLIKELSSIKNFKDKKKKNTVYNALNDSIMLMCSDLGWGNIKKKPETNMLLHYASETDNKNLLRFLLNNGFPANKKDEMGCSAAFKARSPEVLRILVDAGAPIVSSQDNDLNIVHMLDNIHNSSEKAKLSECVFEIMSGKAQNRNSLNSLYTGKMLDMANSFDVKKEDFVKFFNKNTISDINEVIEHDYGDYTVKSNILGHLMYVIFQYTTGTTRNLVSLSSRWSIVNFLLDKGSKVDIDIKVKAKNEKRANIEQSFEGSVFGLFIRSCYTKHMTLKASKKMKKDIFSKCNIENMNLSLIDFEKNLDMFLLDDPVKYPKIQKNNYLMLDKKVKMLYEQYKINFTNKNIKNDKLLSLVVDKSKDFVKKNKSADLFFWSFNLSRKNNIIADAEPSNIIFEDIKKSNNSELVFSYFDYLVEIFDKQSEGEHNTFNKDALLFLKNRMEQSFDLIIDNEESLNLYKHLLLSSKHFYKSSDTESYREVWGDFISKLENKIINSKNNKKKANNRKKVLL